MKTTDNIVLDLAAPITLHFSERDIRVVVAALHYYVEGVDNLDEQRAATVNRVIDMLLAVEMIRPFHELRRKGG